MPYVHFDDNFFQTERNNAYSDWETAIWRELFQNSIDQGAGVIRINMTEDDGLVRIMFTDDGPGMSRDILNTVYFAVGATSKTDGSSIGGFGRARILTCFSMKTYNIRSDDYLVIGKGGHYDTIDMPKMDHGCIVIVEAEDTSVETMRMKLDRFLSDCNIDAAVYINDGFNEIKCGHPGRHVRDLKVDGNTFAAIHVNKSRLTQRVIVRVNGVAMYSVATTALAQVIVELDAAQSRKVLTANRDSMVWSYRRRLDDYLLELAVDTNSALRERFRRQTTISPGGGALTVRRKKPLVPPAATMTGEQATAGFYTEPKVRAADVMPDEADTSTESVIASDPFGDWLKKTFGDIHLYDETQSKDVHKVVTNYVAGNWKQVTMGGKTKRRGGDISKVLLMWLTAVQYVLEVSMDTLNMDDINYNVGFIFADDRLAELREVAGSHVFLLRPVDDKGKLVYSITNRWSLIKLMTLAKHEASHILENWHGESFSGVRERIDFSFDMAECFRRMKSAIKAMPDFT